MVIILGCSRSGNLGDLRAVCSGINTGDRSIFKWIVKMLCFSFCINLLVYIADLLRGQTIILWTSAANLSYVPFIVKYMGLSFIFAVVLPFLATIKIRSTNDSNSKNAANRLMNNNEEREESHEDVDSNSDDNT